MFQKRKNNMVHILIMEQINDVENCLINFESFIRAVCVKNTAHETLKTLSDSVCKAEANADISLRRMIDSFTGGTFLPSTREDLISIATSCDKVANKCESFSRGVVLQRFNFPEEYAEDILRIVSIIHTQFDLLEKSISRLFSDFGGLLKDHAVLDEIRDCETQVDIIEQELYERIFALDIDLAHHVQMSTFLGKICDISDTIENIADKIQIMLVTRKA